MVPREYFGDALAWVGRIGFGGVFTDSGRVLLRESGRDGVADGQMLHIVRTFTMVGNYGLSAQTA